MIGPTTRRTPGGFNESGSSSDPPPPPPLSPLEQLLATQTAILQQLAQGPPHHQHRGRQDHQPQVARYEDFLGTQLPLFSRADEPLEADAWIRAIESKFSILAAPCSEDRKASFTAQQLRGAVLLWWENYRAMLPANHVVN